MADEETPLVNEDGDKDSGVTWVNLNQRHFRFALWSLMFFLWLIPELTYYADSLDNWKHSDGDDVRTYLRLYVTADTILLGLTLYVMARSRTSDLNDSLKMTDWVVGMFVVIGAIMYMSATGRRIKHSCDNQRAWCGSSLESVDFLGQLLPMVLVADLVTPVCNKRHVRLLFVSLLLCVSSITFGSCYVHYNKYQEVDQPSRRLMKVAFFMIGGVCGVICLTMCCVAVLERNPFADKTLHLLYGILLTAAGAFSLYLPYFHARDDLYVNYDYQLVLLVSFTLFVAYEMQHI